MANPVYGMPLRVLEGETKALSTTVGYVAALPGYSEVKMYCATQWRLALSPKLIHALYYTAATGAYVDYVQSVTDRVASTHMPLDGMLATDIVYLGTTEPVLGFYFDIGTNVQDEVATLDMEYCSTAIAPPSTGTGAVAIAFTDVAGDSDGTNSVADTLKTDGAYTFTLPSIVKSTLGTAAIPLFSKCYWTRFKPSATLSATVDIDEIIPIYKNVNYAYMEAGMEYQFSINTGETGGFAVMATAGTPTLDISWVRH